MFKLIEQHKASVHGSRLETQDEDGTSRVYHYINNIPLNASHPNLLVNFLEYWEFKEAEKKFITIVG